MRTLKLSHEQINTLLHALGVAETVFSKLYTDITLNTVITRNNVDKDEQQKIVDNYFKISCKFADLNTDINNSKLDV